MRSRCPTCDAKIVYAGSTWVDDARWPWRALYACPEGHLWRREELTERPVWTTAVVQMPLFEEAPDDPSNPY